MNETLNALICRHARNLLLAQGWRDLGRIPGFGEVEPARKAYWLVAPLPQWRQKKVKALVAHLTA